MKHHFHVQSRFWLALCVLLTGSAAALWLLGGGLGDLITAWAQTGRVIRWPVLGHTLILFGLGTVLSWSSAHLLTALLDLTMPLLRLLGFILGRVAAFFPVHALAWCFLGLWIGQFGQPIWTLMPVTSAVENLPQSEQIARLIWTWAPALALLWVPLTGHWLSLMLAHGPRPAEPGAEDAPADERQLATPHLDSPDPAERGELVPSRIRWRLRAPLPEPARQAAKAVVFHQVPTLRQALWGGGLLALLLLVGIEDTIGISGAGAVLAQRLRAEDFSGAASAWLVLTSIATVWTVLVGGPQHWPLHTARHGAGAVLKLAGWSVAVITVAAGVTGRQLLLMHAINAESAFAAPGSALQAGLPAMLCALSLWLLGHIIVPRNAS